MARFGRGRVGIIFECVHRTQRIAFRAPGAIVSPCRVVSSGLCPERPVWMGKSPDSWYEGSPGRVKRWKAFSSANPLAKGTLPPGPLAPPVELGCVAPAGEVAGSLGGRAFVEHSPHLNPGGRAPDAPRPDPKRIIWRPAK